MAEVGRPTTYTDEIAQAICERLCTGDSLITICKADDMPGRTTVYQWLMRHQEFANKYARARSAGLDAMAEEMLAISDEGENDTYVDENGQERTNHEVVARSRLRVDTRKWLLSKLRPEKYGERVDLNHKGDLTVTISGADATL